jgi:hypothetical protein
MSEYFGKEVYLKSYAPITYHVPSEEQWVQINQLIIEPLKARATTWRLKKCRTRRAEETTNPYTVRNGGVRKINVKSTTNMVTIQEHAL